MEKGDWSELRVFILAELERHDKNIEYLKEHFDEYEKTCLQKEGEQKVVNAETRLKLYFMDLLVGAAGAVGILLVQWLITNF
jgi:hypothetical protein